MAKATWALDDGQRLRLRADSCQDAVESDLFDQLKDGDQITVRGGEILRDGTVVGRGEVQSNEVVADKYEQDTNRTRGSGTHSSSNGA